MPLSPDEAYDRAARRIWNVFLLSLLLPTPLIFVRAWLCLADRTKLYLQLGLALLWCAAVLPLLLIYTRRAFRTRSMLIANAANLFGAPLLLFMRYPSDIVRDCGGSGALEFGALAAVVALCVLLSRWFRAVEKDYLAALPRAECVPAPLPAPAGTTAPSGPPVI
jgi:hypothetical protein